MDPVVQWILGGAVTAAIAIVSGFIRYLFSVIKDLKSDVNAAVVKIEADASRRIQDAATKIEEHKEEVKVELEKIEKEADKRRQETRDLLLELINTKFDAIWESIKDLKNKVN